MALSDEQLAAMLAKAQLMWERFAAWDVDCRRKALVIGHTPPTSYAYPQGARLQTHTLTPLRSRRLTRRVRVDLNDAEAVGAALRDIGFAVVVLTEQTKTEIEDAVGAFRDVLAPGDDAVFYGLDRIALRK